MPPSSRSLSRHQAFSFVQQLVQMPPRTPKHDLKAERPSPVVIALVLIGGRLRLNREVHGQEVQFNPASVILSSRLQGGGLSPF